MLPHPWRWARGFEGDGISVRHYSTRLREISPIMALAKLEPGTYERNDGYARQVVIVEKRTGDR
jgi:hypothetical protein